jgi:hypothetical protein
MTSGIHALNHLQVGEDFLAKVLAQRTQLV